MDCRDFYPMFLLYNRDRLTGFGWVAIGNTDSPRYEHPPAKRLGVSRVTRTQCDASLSFFLGHVRIFGDRVCVLARVLLGCVFLKCLWREHSYAYSMLFSRVLWPGCSHTLLAYLSSNACGVPCNMHFSNALCYVRICTLRITACFDQWMETKFCVKRVNLCLLSRLAGIFRKEFF